MRLKVCTGILLLVVIQGAFALPKGRHPKVRESVEGDAQAVPARTEQLAETTNPEVLRGIVRNAPKKDKRHAVPLNILRKYNRINLQKQVTSDSSFDKEEEKEDAEVKEETQSTAPQTVPKEQLEEQQDKSQTELESPTDDDVTDYEEDIDAGREEIKHDEQEAVIDPIPEEISQTTVQDGEKQPEDVKRTLEQKTSEDAEAEKEESVAITSEKKVKQPTPKKKKGKNITRAQNRKKHVNDVKSLIKGSKAYRDACKWCHPAFSFDLKRYPCWEDPKLADKYICYPYHDYPCASMEPFSPFTPNGMCTWAGHMPRHPLIPGTTPMPGGIKPIKDHEDTKDPTHPIDDTDEEEEEDGDDEHSNHDSEEGDEEEENDDDKEHEEEEEEEDEEEEEEDEEENTKLEKTVKGCKKKNKKGVCTCYCRKKGKKGCQYIQIGSGKCCKKGKNVYVVIVN